MQGVYKIFRRLYQLRRTRGIKKCSTLNWCRLIVDDPKHKKVELFNYRLLRLNLSSILYAIKTINSIYATTYTTDQPCIQILIISILHNSLATGFI